MSRSYKATGINLKAIPLGESDRLLTILTQEQGLVRAVAPGARKHKSRLGGRSGQFVVNELLLVQGKQLDKVIQAETVQSFPGLANHLGKLTAGQYLAELVLCQALSEQPQEALFSLFVEHLRRLEQVGPEGILPGLCQGIFHLLALAGVAPEVQACCLSQRVLTPQLGQGQWQAGFSPVAGGVIHPDYCGEEACYGGEKQCSVGSPTARAPGSPGYGPSPPGILASTPVPTHRDRRSRAPRPTLISGAELALLQRLGRSQLQVTQGLPGVEGAGSPVALDLWLRLERLLRLWSEYHFDRTLRSAELLIACFPRLSP